MPSDQDRLRQAFRHIDRIKAAEYPAIVGSDKGYRIVERPWQDMPEPSKLAILQDQVDWSGISNRDQAHIILGQLDPSKLTDPQRNRLIDAATREEPAAQAEERRSDPQDRPIRPLTKELIECCQLDVWPGMATVVDFGIDSSSHLGALQFAIREGLVTPQELDAAMGSGAELTEIAQRGENPYRDVTFRTSWDEMLLKPDDHPGNPHDGKGTFADILRNSSGPDARSDFQRLLDEAGERGKTQSTEQERGGPER